MDPSFCNSLGLRGGSTLGLSESPQTLGIWLHPSTFSYTEVSTLLQLVLLDGTQDNHMPTLSGKTHICTFGSSPKVLSQPFSFLDVLVTVPLASQVWIRHQCSVHLKLSFSHVGRGTYSTTEIFLRKSLHLSLQNLPFTL